MNVDDTIARLQALIEHPRTNEHERALAERMVKKFLNRRRSVGDRPYRYQFEGEKFRVTDGMDSLQIVSLVREDVKARRKVGRRVGLHGSGLATVDPIAALPPEARVTVRRTWSTHTPCITVTVRGLVGDRWWMRIRGYVTTRDLHEFPHAESWPTMELTTIGDALQRLVEAYGFNDSDSQTDYFHRRFFSYVEAVAPDGPMEIDRLRFYEHVTTWIGADGKEHPSQFLQY